MDYQSLKTPNARLLYSRCNETAKDWEEKIQKVDSFLEKESRFQVATPYIYLYFFSPSASTEFNQLESWAGREVIGLPQEFDEQQNLAIYDLEQGKCISVNNSSETFSFGDLWSEESKIRAQLSNKLSLADTWRLRLEQIESKTKLEFQFFPL
jgi:hypothetical protein